MLPDRGVQMVRVPYINTVATGENINRMRMEAS